MQRRFRRHALAIAVAMACQAFGAQAAPDRPLLMGKTAAEVNEAERYLVKLKSEASFNQVRANSTGTLERRSALAPRFFWMTLSPEAAAELAAMPDVASVTLDPVQNTTHTLKKSTTTAFTLDTRSVQASPLSTDPEAGKGVRVAVVSTGMDYTHALLGGPGTAEAYEEALANHAALWDGFPTAVVVGGLDVKSESGLVDPNPIEDAVADVDRSAYPEMPIGRGTLLGSVIHKLAPGAELLAYKMYSVRSDGRGNLISSFPNAETLDRAFTHIVDPNGDGDFSDRAHIALIDTAGGLAFYDPYESAESGDSLLINLVQALTARGVLVVTDTGTYLPDSRYSISWIGAAPDALTVGAMNEFAEGTYAAAPFSARGPVRGPTRVMKPDLVSHGYEVTGADAGTGTETVTETSNNVAAARVAAAAAILKSSRPELSALDIKTLLTNTARHDILASDASGAPVAEVTYIGHGREDLEAALATRAMVRTEENHQPSLNFGFREFDRPGRLTRRLVVRNMSDEDQSFIVSHSMRGEKANHAAVSLEYPATVYVPANRQVTIDVGIHVDPAKLAPWPLRATDDYTDANWSSVQLNGYLTLSGTGEASQDLSVAWMITPRAKTVIEKDFTTVRELYESLGGEESPPELALADGFAEWGAVGYTMEFTNAGVADASFAALPMIARNEEIPANLKNSSAHILRYVSGGVFEEAACRDTQKKLVIAATLHKPAEVATANYFDKVGDVIFTYSMIREQTVIDRRLNESISQNDLIWMVDEDYVTHGWVTINAEGKPVTVTLDLDMEYDDFNPTARYRESTLPTYFSSHSRNVISQVCVEDILHHRMTDEELNTNVGLVIGTDRMTLPEQYTPVIQFNPTRYGYLADCSDWGCSHNDGAKVSLELAPGSERPEFNHMLEVAAGDRVKITALKEDVCDGLGWFGPPPPCNRRFVLMGLEGDLAIGAKVAAGDDETVIPFVREGQQFTVAENTEAGTSLGRIKLDSDGFFGIGANPDSPWFDFEIYLANALPGDPFLVKANGELIVNNAAALDYEMMQSFTLTVRTRDGYHTSRSTDVVVYVTNVNDIAPSYSGGLGDVSLDIGDSVSIDVGSHFHDVEGDSLSFTVEGLPGGLSFNAGSGMIEGSVNESGNFAVTVHASDGVHVTDASFTLRVKAAAVADVKRKSGGGAFGLWLFALMLVSRRIVSSRKQ